MWVLKLSADPLRVVAGAILIASIAIAGCATPPLAQTAIDWNRADRWSVHVVTEDADGDLRVARIWIVVLDGVGVIRTEQSRWWKNLERGSLCWIRTGGFEYPVEVEVVTDLARRRRIDAAFATKYGWQERIVISEDRAATDDHYMRLTARGAR